MDQKPNNKRKVLWLSVGAAALVALIVTTILILFGKGGILAGRNNKGELDVVVADLYWNVDREANTDPNTGLSTREPDSNGLYRVRFSYNGKQIEITTRVTDRMEERGDNHKRAVAVERAHRKFEEDHTRWIEIEETGTHKLVWTDETYLVR